jgi:hypothetical protein
MTDASNPVPAAAASDPAVGPVVEAAPAASAPPWERLAARVVGYWWITDSLGVAFLIGLLWIGRQLARDHWIEGKPWLDQAFPWAVLVLAASAILVPPLAWWRWRFACDRDLLRMRYGILFQEERVIPVRRMQHIDLMRGPIERLFGLATLVVFTAGNDSSSFRVPGIKVARAQWFRDRILEARGECSL